MPVPNPTAPRRRRFSPEHKASLVAACLQPGSSVSAVALANGINTNMVHRWIREHERGMPWDSPSRARTYTKRSAEFKQAIVAQSQQPGVRLQDVAAAHGVYPSLIRKWAKKLQAGQPAPSVSPPVTPPVEWQPVIVAEQVPLSQARVLPEQLPTTPVLVSEATASQIDIEVGGARITLRGTPDLKTLRVVLEALR